MNNFHNIKYREKFSKKDKIGDRFGRLTILGEGFYLTLKGKRQKRYLYVVCECDCGTIKVIMLNHMKRTSYTTISCGCYQKEISSNPSKNYCTYNSDNTVSIHCKHGDVIVDKDIFEEKIREYCVYTQLHKDKIYKTVKIIVETDQILSRYLLYYPENMDVDHINCNRLDNRLKNLRFVTPEQNSRNKKSRKNTTSKYKGVSYNKINKNWRSILNFNKKTIQCGSFKTEKEAALAYDEKARQFHGEYGRYNFPQEGERSALN